MKKYIDADLLESDLEASNESVLFYMGVFDVINSQPSADVEEVRHGARWEKSGNKILCSACKFYYFGTRKFKYCPCCGAKMDIDLNVSREKGTHEED